MTDVPETAAPAAAPPTPAAGLLAAIVGGVLWALDTVIAEFQIGFMAVGVGLLVAGAVLGAGRGEAPLYGVSARPAP